MRNISKSIYNNIIIIFYKNLKKILNINKFNVIYIIFNLIFLYPLNLNFYILNLIVFLKIYNDNL